MREEEEASGRDDRLCCMWLGGCRIQVEEGHEEACGEGRVGGWICEVGRIPGGKHKFDCLKIRGGMEVLSQFRERRATWALLCRRFGF